MGVAGGEQGVQRQERASVTIDGWVEEVADREQTESSAPGQSVNRGEQARRNRTGRQDGRMEQSQTGQDRTEGN